MRVTMRMKDRVTGSSPFLLIPLSLKGGGDNVMTLLSQSKESDTTAYCGPKQSLDQAQKRRNPESLNAGRALCYYRRASRTGREVSVPGER